MGRIFSKRRLTLGGAGLCILCCIAGFLVFPAQAAGGAREGIRLCMDVILPSLFPFFVLSTLLVEMGYAAYAGRRLEGVMRPVFRLNGACASAVALGFLGGYPVGAKTAIALYQKGLCSETEAERLLSFCNNSGPAFILGAVGVGIFADSRAGLTLYLAHTAASLTVGFLFRFYKRDAPGGGQAAPSGVSPPPESVGLARAFVRSVGGAFRSALSICAFVIFFTVAVKLLFLSGILPALAEGLGFLFAPFGLTAEAAQQMLTGLLEITSGLWSLQGSSAALSGQLSMAAFMLGWAGLSVHCQVLSFIGESGLKAWTYVAGKVLHAGISAGYTLLMARLFGLNQPVSAYLAAQVGALARVDFHSTLGVALLVTLGVWLFFLGATWKAMGSRERSAEIGRRTRMRSSWL
ncbi:MAG: sporulation protein [Oscillospiraceae bacterium]|jgi:sporulation integral membrane protein YlbJ|nr:sporulation protein [Oscillospiraceae bacterium]